MQAVLGVITIDYKLLVVQLDPLTDIIRKILKSITSNSV